MDAGGNIMRKIQKGHYGYIRARKKTLLIRTIILFLGVFILLAMGFALTHTKKNLLTVAAIVSVLPAANQAVVLFAISWKRKRRIRIGAGNGWKWNIGYRIDSYL